MMTSQTQQIMNYYFTPDENPSNNNLSLSNFASSIDNDLAAFHLNRFLTNHCSPNHQITVPVQEFAPHSNNNNNNNYSSCISSNSTSTDEAEDQFGSMIDERKQRRMISNRESARRSRMRKQRHLDELWSQVVRLRNENRNLIEKLNGLSESHETAVRENECLKEEASDLREMVRDLQMSSCGFTN